MSKQILVTGGAGYIGSACVKELLDLGHKVTVLDNLSNGDKKYIDERAEFIKADLREKESLEHVFSARAFSAVLHFAALKAVGQSEEHPTEYFKNNVGGTINLLSAMETHNVPEIIFSSSAAVYAPTQDNICTEKSKLGAINVYGNCKIIEEMLIQELTRTRKIKKYSILRYFNVAGDTGLNYIDKAPENVFPILANSLTLGERFNIFGTDYDTRDGTCVRDYIHLADLVGAHIKALEHPESGIWNLGTSKGTTVKELVAMFEQVSGKTINIEALPPRAGDPATLLANSGSAATTLNWQPQKTLREMVESTLYTYQKT